MSDERRGPQDEQSDPETPTGVPGLDDLTPEQRRQISNAMEQASVQLGRLGKIGCMGLIGRMLFGWIRLPRLRARRVGVFLFGILIVVLSVTTCSWGMDPATLTADYGTPVPATKDAASRLLTRAGNAIRNAPNSRNLRISVTEEEATSALSLGMLLPEVMRAMESIPAEELEAIPTVEGMRERLRQEEEAALESRTLTQRIFGFFDPRLRTGDTQVRFTADGEIVVGGYIQAWRWKQPALVVVAPRATSGELALDFVRGQLGRLPAPEWAFDKLGELLSSLILLGQDYAEITEMTVTEGRMSFLGRVTG